MAGTQGALTTDPPPPARVLSRFSRACPEAADLPATCPPHAAIARVWMLGDAYVLRARAGGPGVAESFAREQALLERLAPLVTLGLPMPLAADDGQRHVLHDGDLWTLHRALPGRVLRPWQDLHRAPDDERRALLCALRDLHDRTAGRLGDGDGNWLARDAGARFAEVRHLLSQRARARVDRALERHRGRVPVPAPAFVHGDFHWGNLLVDAGGRVTGLVDLDWCRVADPVEDLAYTAMMLARDYDRGRPRLDDLPRLLGWYGLPSDAGGAFAEAFVLYAMFDVHLFLGAAGLSGRERYVEHQVALLEEAVRAL